MTFLLVNSPSVQGVKYPYQQKTMMTMRTFDGVSSNYTKPLVMITINNTELHSLWPYKYGNNIFYTLERCKINFKYVPSRALYYYLIFLSLALNGFY